ncbi:MAG: TIGR00282 family metallophosphoesterase [Candidatus Omnitrophica bacterium]|nr:TIGR00282 family metallophosphoesterase [Candidatus Omnitrophota bacterium]
MSTLRVLIVGDIVGKPGREVCLKLIPELRRDKDIQFVIANGENIAGGSSITPDTIKDLFKASSDVITLGDHTFRKKESVEVLQKDARVIRPANYPAGTPGVGFNIIKSHGVQIGIINLLGRVFMEPMDCPFQTVRNILSEIKDKTPIIFVDMHAEATSEKVAMGWFLDGKVSCVYGTHTHIQTSDERILPKGTAYITDVGMTGPYHSVIGREIEPVLYKFLTGLPSKYDVATEDVRLSGAIVDVDMETGKALHIERVHEYLNRV